MLCMKHEFGNIFHFSRNKLNISRNESVKFTWVIGTLKAEFKTYKFTL